MTQTLVGPRGSIGGARRRALAGALAAAALAVAAPAAAQKGPLGGLDAYTARALKDWQGAGLAIAVVKDDSVVFAKGYGVREVGKPAKVDDRTLFAIGSNTKLFTAVLAGTMVDEGKMSWDDRATKWLPGFQLYDPYVSREITIRDMLSHRSGLGRRGDLLWYGSALDRQQILHRIRFLEPNSSFRSQFGYQNIMVLGAGEAVAAAGGKSWDDLVRERIFQPLGMSASNTSVKALDLSGNVAAPHQWMDGKPVPVPYRDIDNIGPAGSINSNVRDMAQWLRMLLEDGSYGGRQIVKATTLQEIESPQTITAAMPDSLRPSTHFGAYGLGVGMVDYKGVKVLQHTGGIDGMLSLVAFVPEKQLGLVVLTNTAGHNALFQALMYRVLDAYLGGPTRDWSAILLAQTKTQEARAEAAQKKAEAARVPGTKPSLPLEKYAGTYADSLYGQARVSLEDGHLVLRYGPAFTGDLEHWNYDTFRAKWRGAGLGGGTALVGFALDAAGVAARMDVEGIAEFKRVPESARVSAAP
ncbi:MAG TPA: serine hydrolase [Longimicrobiales bacterium]|nr:serine hydrolase [Longimicrobiales bacterium]